MDETITITYDGTTKTVALDDFVKSSRKMLYDFGINTTEGMIRSQIHQILSGGKTNVVGVFLKDYIVKEKGAVTDPK